MKQHIIKERSRTEYSLINMFTGVAGYGINTIVGFVCRIIFVRALSADYLGVNGLFANIISVLSLAELGISSAIIYELYKPLAEKNVKKIASIMRFYRKAYMAIGAFVAVVGLVMIPFLTVIIQNPPEINENIYLLYLLHLVSTVISYFFSYRQSLLVAAQRQYIVSGYSYVITIVQSALQIVYLIMTHEYIGYLLIQIIGGITYNIWISGKVAKDYPFITDKNIEPLPKDERKSLLKNIKALAVNKVSGVLVNSTDNIAITYFTGIGSVGLASNYVIFSKTLDSLVTPLFNALTGSVGNLNATTDDETKYRFFKTLNLANFWFYGWASIGMAFVSGDLVKLFYGEQYQLSFDIPLILAINLYTIGMLHAPYTYKSTLGLFRYGQYLLILTGIINLILDVILGKLFGMFGVYLSTLIARMCTNLWYEPYAVYRYGLKKKPVLYFIRYLFFLLVLVLAGGICWLGCGLCHFAGIGNIVCKFLICSVVPNGVFLLFFGRTEEFRYLKNRVIHFFMSYIHKKKM
ncbi:MAG: sugar translocase [Ruminococcaceae bacterium]|nr:sugar translocase [Oscillospiraceae bacterium]